VSEYVTLKSKFFRLYSVNVDKNISLNLCGDWINSVWVWNLIWRRVIFEWEKLQVCQLLEVVQGSSSILTFDNRWTWQVGESLEFSINSTYGILREEIEEESSHMFKFF